MIKMVTLTFGDEIRKITVCLGTSKGEKTKAYRPGVGGQFPRIFY